MNDIKQSPQVILKKTEPGDLEALFGHQLDEEAAYMAAFVNENWNDKNAYLEKWNRLLHDETINTQTIFLDNKVAGSVLTWQMNGELQISYGLRKAYWNKGIATHALQQFLTMAPARPLYGRVAFDNIGSARVLAKCGFQKTGEELSYAFARKAEIVEFIFLLEV